MHLSANERNGKWKKELYRRTFEIGFEKQCCSTVHYLFLHLLQKLLKTFWNWQYLSNAGVILYLDCVLQNSKAFLMYRKRRRRKKWHENLFSEKDSTSNKCRARNWITFKIILYQRNHVLMENIIAKQYQWHRTNIPFFLNQDGACQQYLLPELSHFHLEATLSTTNYVSRYNFVHSLKKKRHISV